MNHKTFNLFLIVLLSSLAIIVDSNKPKTCTITKTKSKTVTFTNSCGTLLPQTTHGCWCPKKANYGNCKGCKKTKIVTCTPTTTKKICPPTLTPKEKCCNLGGIGQSPINITYGNSAYGSCQTTVNDRVSCCNCCYDDPKCSYWIYVTGGPCYFYNLDGNCSNNTFSAEFFAGIIGCNKCRANQ